MKTLIEDEYRDTLKAAGVVENFVRQQRRQRRARARPSSAPKRARTATRTRSTSGRTTKHAKAFDSLVHDPKPNTVFDAECISCHTTGFEYNSGWKSEKETPYLAGNQCENCHGPARSTSPSPITPSFASCMHLDARAGRQEPALLPMPRRGQLARFRVRASTTAEIVHKGLDVYNDPKVHQGITPKALKPVGRQPKFRDRRFRIDHVSVDPSDPLPFDAATQSIRRSVRGLGMRKEFRIDERFHEDGVRRGGFRRSPRPMGLVGSRIARTTSNPVNHFLHVGVGWPMAAVAVVLLPFRPLWSLALFVSAYAIMFFGHFVFERNIPTIFKQPSTPFVVAFAVIRKLCWAGIVRLATPSNPLI